MSCSHTAFAANVNVVKLTDDENLDHKIVKSYGLDVSIKCADCGADFKINWDNAPEMPQAGMTWDRMLQGPWVAGDSTILCATLTPQDPQWEPGVVMPMSGEVH